MFRLILLASLLAMPVVCLAEVYKWVDEKGAIGFADDLGNVPKKYRGKALPADQFEAPSQVVDEVAVDKPLQKKDSAPKAQTAVPADKGKEIAEPLFDGRSGTAWKKDFERQKYEITNLEAQAAGMKDRMANPGKVSRGEYLMLQNSVRDFDSRISVARKKLEALQEAADRVDLPADFR